MKNYILKRLGFAVLTLILLVILVFFLQSLIPANPFTRDPKNPTKFEEDMAAAGLLKPLIEQLYLYVIHLFGGSWGQIYSTNQSVWNVMTSPILYTVILTIPAAFISVIVGVPLGICAANYRGKWPDALINGLAVIFMAVPTFILVLLFTSWFHGIFAIQFRPWQIVGVGGMLRSYTIPVLCLALYGIAPYVYYTRNEMVEVLKEDYIQTAQSKGLKWRTVLWKHAFRNGMIPMTTLILSNIMILITGSFVIEGMFNIPGVAPQMVFALTNREVNQIMFITIFFGLFNLIGQIITDVSYVFVDPRISYGVTTKPSYWKRFKAMRTRAQRRKEIMLQNVEESNI